MIHRSLKMRNFFHLFKLTCLQHPEKLSWSEQSYNCINMESFTWTLHVWQNRMTNYRFCKDHRCWVQTRTMGSACHHTRTGSKGIPWELKQEARAEPWTRGGITRERKESSLILVGSSTMRRHKDLTMWLNRSPYVLKGYRWWRKQEKTMESDGSLVSHRTWHH